MSYIQDIYETKLERNRDKEITSLKTTVSISLTLKHGLVACSDTLKS